MTRSKGEMSSPRVSIALVALSFVASCTAGPLPEIVLTNVTGADLGLKEGGCAVGDVVYLPGDEFPGASACERCRCAGGAVQCTRTRCEPRPGCKALHRPDHCCPTYQCECEQEGRVYGNGEKLVDPQDPCRVCYCQGGEVVCRRIACFLRDDCTPRLVPGRCCPEYDNCPLRGVTSIPGATPVTSAVEEISSLAPAPPKENIKQEITIKEITPVSEIPIIPEVKVKEILPSAGIEVPNYSSSKSPLIVREATSENTITDVSDSRTEKPAITEIQPSVSSAKSSILPEVPIAPTKPDENIVETKTTNDVQPSKISLSTQDSINNDMYPSISTVIATMGVPSINPEQVQVTLSTRAPLIEEEETSFLDHNPAFPILPDDLSVPSNHEDDLAQEQIDNDHIPEAPSHPIEQHEVAAETSATTTAFVATTVDSVAIISKTIPDTTPQPLYIAPETTTHQSSTRDVIDLVASSANPAGSPYVGSDTTTINIESIISTETTKIKDSPMLNLRSAIPTEILDVPSSVQEDITGELDDATDISPAASETVTTVNFVPTESAKENERSTKKKLPEEYTTSSSPVPSKITEPETSTIKVSDISTGTETVTSANLLNVEIPQEKTENPLGKSSIFNEITAQTEFSSLPIETSDQNPKENAENIETEIFLASTENSSVEDLTTMKPTSIESEVIITVSRSPSSSIDSQSSIENVETTEFIINAFESSESTTDTVELIKISADPDKSAAIIELEPRKKNSVLTDLINLVGDVAAIGDHTDGPEQPHSASTAKPTATATSVTSISDSEELIPVNVGYKSKNSNWNLNSITEVPTKNKGPSSVSKQKVIEIEDEESDSITDSPPPNDKVEPTTRRPIIDNVSDDARSENRTEKKDIEIITKSYVPTLSRRPTKVVMKKNNEQPVTMETSTDFKEPEPTETSVEDTSSEARAKAKQRAEITTSPADKPSTATTIDEGDVHSAAAEPSTAAPPADTAHLATSDLSTTSTQ